MLGVDKREASSKTLAIHGSRTDEENGDDGLVRGLLRGLTAVVVGRFVVVVVSLAYIENKSESGKTMVFAVSKFRFSLRCVVVLVGRVVVRRVLGVGTVMTPLTFSHGLANGFQGCGAR